jgi:hypothetical protein
MTERQVAIPDVNPDNVINGLSHVCPFASGKMFKWKCQILLEKVGVKKTKWDFVRCPETMEGEIVGYGKGNKVRVRPAPTECPFRDGPVIIYDERFAGCIPEPKDKKP